MKMVVDMPSRITKLLSVFFALFLMAALGPINQAYAEPLGESEMAPHESAVGLAESSIDDDDSNLANDETEAFATSTDWPEESIAQEDEPRLELLTDNGGAIEDASKTASLAATAVNAHPDESLSTAETSALQIQGTNSGMIADGVYTVASAFSGSNRMEIGGASQKNGAGANIYEDNRTAAQRWYITSLGGGFYKIMNVSSGKYLDVAGANVYSGAKVQQYEWNGTKAQQWAIESTGSGYKLYSALSKKYVLDLSGGNTKNGTVIQLYESNDTTAQRWKLNKIDPVLANGIYTIEVKSSGQVLDVSGASVNNSANVQQYTPNETMAQSFYLSYNSKNGYYTVLNAASGLALDVAGAANRNGANVQMYAPNDTSAQRWAIAKNSDGTFTLHSAVGGLALDVSGASQNAGANVQTYASNGTAAQKWKFTGGSAWSIPDGVYNIVTTVNKANSLAVSGYSRNSSANVQTAATLTTNWGQKWIVAKASGGYYTIRNLNSRMLLDVSSGSTASGANVQQYTENATDAQLWKPELTAGGIVFRSKVNNSNVLDIASASTRAGANVQVYESNGTAAQKFCIKSVNAIDSGTTYVFTNVETGKVLDVVSASKDNGAVVQLYESNGTVAQKFRAISSSGNVYYLQNINSQKYIDVDTSTKTTVRQWEGKSGSDKQWQVALDNSTGTFTIKSVYTGTYLDGTSGTLSLKAKSSTDAQQFALQPLTFKLFLDAGHIVGKEGYDSGAVGNGYTEAQLTSDLTDRIYKICVEEYGLDVVDGKTFGISYEKRTSKAYELGCTALVSIHFNAGGGSGSMTIVGGSGRRNANSPELANIMHTYLAQGVGLYDYGVVTRDDLAIPNDSRIAATLLEVAFIDNSYDMQVYNSKRDAVARSLAKGIYEASLSGAFNG